MQIIQKTNFVQIKNKLCADNTRRNKIKSILSCTLFDFHPNYLGANVVMHPNLCAIMSMQKCLGVELYAVMQLIHDRNSSLHSFGPGRCRYTKSKLYNIDQVYKNWSMAFRWNHFDAVTFAATTTLAASPLWWGSGGGENDSVEKPRTHKNCISVRLISPSIGCLMQAIWSDYTDIDETMPQTKEYTFLYNPASNRVCSL